jgi:hypothetical protein
VIRHDGAIAVSLAMSLSDQGSLPSSRSGGRPAQAALPIIMTIVMGLSA